MHDHGRRPRRLRLARARSPSMRSARSTSSSAACPLALLGAHADRMRDLLGDADPARCPGRPQVRALRRGGIAAELGHGGVAGAELELADTLVAFSRALARPRGRPGPAPGCAGSRHGSTRTSPTPPPTPAGSPARTSSPSARCTACSRRRASRCRPGCATGGWRRAGADLADPRPGGSDGRRDRTAMGLDRRGGLQPPFPAPRTAARRAPYALSVSFRGPERNPSSTSVSSTG